MKNKTKFNLRPLPRGMVELYGLMAILLVIIPEWLAELALTIKGSNSSIKLPFDEINWEEIPELKLTTLTLFQLRGLAMKFKIPGYSSDNRYTLIKRLTKHIKSRNAFN